MSKVQKNKVVKILKEKVEVPRSEPIEIKEKPQRKSRAKKQPTREEALKSLLDTSNELKQIILDLKEDESKLSGMASQFKKVPELLKVTIENMEEDQKEIDEHYQEILALPDDQPSN